MIGTKQAVSFRELPRRGTMTEMEVSGEDFNATLAEAESLVARIKAYDYMRSPMIVSRTRTDDGSWRFVVRSWGLD